MEEFNTLEKAIALFQERNCYFEENNIFVVYKDMQKYGGGLVNGMESGMEYPFEGLIVNDTNRGLAMIPLKQGGLVLTQAMEKMEVDKERSVIFIPKENITSITIKNFALLNSKAKRISIKTTDNKDYKLYTKKDEKNIPYQLENFAKFVQSHQ